MKYPTPGPQGQPDYCLHYAGWKRAEVCEIAGISLKHLENWMNFRYLPKHEKRWGVFSVQEVRRIILFAALAKGGGLRPSVAAKLIDDPESFGAKTLAEIGLPNEEAGEKIFRHLEDAERRALKLHEDRTAKKDLRIVKSNRTTKVERGFCAFAGVCVHGRNILLISPGPQDHAFAAALGDADAEKLLAAMHEELARDGEEPERTLIQTCEVAPEVFIQVLPGYRLAIGAGRQGGIMASLTRADFEAVTVGLRASVENGARTWQIPATDHPGARAALQ